MTKITTLLILLFTSSACFGQEYLVDSLVSANHTFERFDDFFISAKKFFPSKIPNENIINLEKGIDEIHGIEKSKLMSQIHKKFSTQFNQNEIKKIEAFVKSKQYLILYKKLPDELLRTGDKNVEAAENFLISSFGIKLFDFLQNCQLLAKERLKQPDFILKFKEVCEKNGVK